ncbi:hypothetical protein LEP1GSC188_0901 [Leptospira weilii serovar Topaz str. LT2116]|uniref:Uncharacterized protein n=1 Tax=Leptospira weilii serovar Topaz str. LT2116 TaxID=1088540 RepID=M3GYN2_9LEPT|nr:hypothetical protein LEP1GSC188_0901 [Leptospira weilii serovar Topaz str. LT2116]
MQVKSLILVGTLEKYQFLILMIPKAFLISGQGYDSEAVAEFGALLRLAKNQRLRFAAFGYLASGTVEKLAIGLALFFAAQRTNAFASRLLAISLPEP